MNKSVSLAVADREMLYRRAGALARITIYYNVIEGVVSVLLGAQDETVALFGFGVDSFVEVMSGIGIWHMVRRLGGNGDVAPDPFERRALRITGSSFYILAAGLIVTALLNLYRGHAPETTLWGIVVSSISIVTMWLLARYKLNVGRALGSDAIIADAGCTRVCLYLSFVLLASSIGYEITGVGGIDSIGALGISWFALREGRESFLKARGQGCGCSGRCSA